MICTLCEERPQLPDSALDLCARCAEMIFNQLCQEALKDEKQEQLNEQEDKDRA